MLKASSFIVPITIPLKDEAILAVEVGEMGKHHVETDIGPALLNNKLSNKLFIQTGTPFFRTLKTIRLKLKMILIDDRKEVVPGILFLDDTLSMILES